MWAMVNALLLSEARARGWGIYRNVMRRVGFGLEGGRVLTKGRLREILEQEDRMRVLVSQLSTVRSRGALDDDAVGVRGQEAGQHGKTHVLGAAVGGRGRGR